MNAAVSKTVYGYSPYEGSNPSSSAIMHRVNEPEWLVFCMSTLGHDSRDAVGAGRFIGALLLPGNPDSANAGACALGGSCGWLKLCLMMGVASETTAFIGIHFSHANGED